MTKDRKQKEEDRGRVRLIIVGPEDNGDGVYCIATEQGEVLASHLCSHAGYAREDLEGSRRERKEEWRKRFGDYKVVWLEDSGISREEFLKRNKEWWDDSQENHNAN